MKCSNLRCKNYDEDAHFPCKNCKAKERKPKLTRKEKNREKWERKNGRRK